MDTIAWKYTTIKFARSSHFHLADLVSTFQTNITAKLVTIRVNIKHMRKQHEMKYKQVLKANTKVTILYHPHRPTSSV